MKRLIVKVLAFSALVAVTFCGICAAEIFAEIRAYRREILMPAEAVVAVSGDSQAAMGVDTAHFPEFFNFAAHGRALDQAELILKDILQTNAGKIKLAILDVTPANAGNQLDLPLSQMGYSAQYYLLYLLHRDETFRDLSGIVKVVRDNMVGRRLRCFSRALRGKQEFFSSLRGKFTPDAVVFSQANPVAFRALIKERAELVGKELPLRPDSKVVSVLERLKELEKGGVRVVLMTSPWCAELRTACDQDLLDGFRSAMRDCAERHHIDYLDFIDLPLGADCWRDGHHLNARGAKAFTEALRQKLEERGLLARDLRR